MWSRLRAGGFLSHEVGLPVHHFCIPRIFKERLLLCDSALGERGKRRTFRRKIDMISVTYHLMHEPLNHPQASVLPPLNSDHTPPLAVPLVRSSETGRRA